jgi:Domain of unknown function (DUF4395)
LASAVWTAHPYDDLTVIDERAPRTNQLVVGGVSLLAVLTGAWWLVTALAAQLAVGLALGRRWCLPCRLYFDVIQPRIGEGPLEDARPPRFANFIALGFGSAITALFGLGLDSAGWIVAGVLCVVALFSGLSGFCVGCWIHRRLFGTCDVCDIRPDLA